VSADITPGVVSLTGAVPSEDARTALINSITKAIPGISVDDHLLVDDSVSDHGLSGFAAVLAPIGDLSRLDNASVTVTLHGGTVTLSGTVPTKAAAAAARAAATALTGSPDKVTSDLKTPPTQKPTGSTRNLQVVLDQAQPITFATDSCILSPPDRSTVRAIAAAIMTTDKQGTLAVNLAVDGFADSRGPAAYNVTLSRCRALSVYRTLVGLGVDRTQLTIHGFGENDPVASNRTAAGRSANRRVEIHISN
jgi:OOP family OmpA-OmpF porin